MGWLSWIVLGLISGVIAKFLLPGHDGGGLIWTTVVGIIGAFIGGYVGTRIGWGDANALDLRSIGISVLGAIIFLVLLRIAT
ncbi:GlsB/YeaQ/YmgE family stress response membrane protein [Zavarzinia compransoris]|uniref:GlsB/YeaQ/YmgE family stress response membrane protein n=1 Tax=Zavarzinia marina TaxID=2911065 RepID=UPI001F491238|nr:GlsB/YeaQ/YmgE family stress response membrane protein [Zavarzinia marina]MCF4165217.1 GlsB/YeaQ/YmgE family stress response membrane protein [Zavarzinia marina]